MRLISQEMPAPRLLLTVVPEVRERPPERVTMRSRLKGASLIAGNGRAIFLGILLGAVLLSTIGVLYVRHQEERRRAEEERTVVDVSTHSVSLPAPIMIRISPDVIHVTAISLGHPRLAIINGQQSAEGDSITLHTPSANVTVTLRVMKISDGQIELSDGTQVITAHVELPSLPRPKS